MTYLLIMYYPSRIWGCLKNKQLLLLLLLFGGIDGGFCVKGDLTYYEILELSLKINETLKKKGVASKAWFVRILRLLNKVPGKIEQKKDRFQTIKAVFI